MQSSSIADLKSLQATCTVVNHFLMPQRVNWLKDLELEVRSVIEKNRKKRAAQFNRTLWAFLLFGSMGAVQLYRHSYRILPKFNYSTLSPADLALSIVVFSIAMAQNSFYIYKYAAIPFLNYFKSHRNKTQRLKIQGRIKELSDSIDAAPCTVQLMTNWS